MTSFAHDMIKILNLIEEVLTPKSQIIEGDGTYKLVWDLSRCSPVNLRELTESTLLLLIWFDAMARKIILIECVKTLLGHDMVHRIQYNFT